MKCPNCNQVMYRQSYTVRGWRRHQVPCEVHWFLCRACQIKIRYVFVKEDDFFHIIENYDRHIEGYKARIRELEERITVLNLDERQASKHLDRVRETLRKLLRGLFLWLW